MTPKESANWPLRSIQPHIRLRHEVILLVSGSPARPAFLITSCSLPRNCQLVEEDREGAERRWPVSSARLRFWRSRVATLQINGWPRVASSDRDRSPCSQLWLSRFASTKPLETTMTNWVSCRCCARGRGAAALATLSGKDLQVA
jgi:hypothetical protein